MRRPVVGIGILLCLVVAAACGSSSPGAGGAASADAGPAEQAASIARAVAAGRVVSACGATPPSRVPFDVVAVTSNQCLSCLDVGGLLREAQRDIGRSGGNLWVLSSRADTADVCRFVRAEKIRLPVLFVADTSFPRGDRPGHLLLMSFDSAGVLTRTKTAATGMQLLAQMRGQPGASSMVR